jgi:hypothetical protein
LCRRRLRSASARFCGFTQVDLEQLSVAESGLDVLGDQHVELFARAARFTGDHRCICQQSVRDPVLQGDQQRRLVAEMPVDAGGADAGDS